MMGGGGSNNSTVENFHNCLDDYGDTPLSDFFMKEVVSPPSIAVVVVDVVVYIIMVVELVEFVMVDVVVTCRTSVITTALLKAVVVNFILKLWNLIYIGINPNMSFKKKMHFKGHQSQEKNYRFIRSLMNANFIPFSASSNDIIVDMVDNTHDVFNHDIIHNDVDKKDKWHSAS